MTVLMVHNYYQKRNPSGENTSFEAEVALLRRHGHRVETYVRHSDEINHYSLRRRIGLALQVIWAQDSYEDLRKLLGTVRPTVAHLQNTFPLISPSAIKACREAGVPLIQTLRNYRLLCLNAQFYRDSHPCEDCVGRTLPWPGLVHACYRNSRAQTAVVATMLTVHRLLRTWQEVDIFIALTEFSRQKLSQAGGIPVAKIAVKPNFVYPDPGMRESRGNYALFIGRLSPEKGLRILLQAWMRVHGVPLKLVGDGSMAEEIINHVRKYHLNMVEMTGRRTSEEVIGMMKNARFLVFPSEWYEAFPRVLLEAFACGVPVIASRLGAMAEIVEDGRTGLLFEPGNAEDLAAKVAWAWTHPKQIWEMGWEARQEYERKYTAERNYEKLIEIYQIAIEEARKRG